MAMMFHHSPSNLPAFTWRRVLWVTFSTLVMQAVAGYFIVRFYGRPSALAPNEKLEFLAVVLLSNTLIALFWLWFQVVWREQNGWAGLGFKRLTGRQIALALLAGMAAFMANMLITSMMVPIFGRPKSMAMLAGAEGAAPLAVGTIFLAAVVIAPMMEEMLFRGLIYGRLRRHFAPVFAALIAALAHSVVHLDRASIVGLIVVFAFFAWLYERFQSLWAPILAHACHNALVLSLIAARL